MTTSFFPSSSQAGSASPQAAYFYCKTCCWPRPRASIADEKAAALECEYCAASRDKPIVTEDPSFGDHGKDSVYCLLGRHTAHHNDIISTSRSSLIPHCGLHLPYSDTCFTCGNCGYKRPGTAMRLTLDGTSFCTDQHQNAHCRYCEAWGEIPDAFRAAVCSCPEQPEHECFQDDLLGNTTFDAKLKPENVDETCVCVHCFEQATQPDEDEDMEVKPGQDPIRLEKENLNRLEGSFSNPDIDGSGHSSCDVKHYPGNLKITPTSPGYVGITGLDMSQVHSEYRGKDEKSFLVKNTAKKSRGMKKTVPINKLNPAVITFMGNEASATFGQISTSSKAESIRYIQVEYNVSTQWPHIRLRLADPTGDKTKVWHAYIYSNSLEAPKQDSDAITSLQTTLGTEVSADLDIPASVKSNQDNGVLAAYAAGELWATVADMNSSRPIQVQAKNLMMMQGTRYAALSGDTAMDDDIPASQPSSSKQAMTEPSRSKVKFRGITLAKLESLLACDASTRNFLSMREQVVVWLLKPSFRLFIHTCFPKESISVVKQCADYFVEVMSATMKLGFLWFYRLEAASDLPFIAANFPLEELPVPRWLITQWDITFNEANAAISSIPTQCGDLIVPPMAPSAGVLVFAYKLAIMREREHQSRVISEGQLSETPDVFMRVLRYPNQENIYMLSAWIHGSDPMTVPAKLPLLDSRIAVLVRGLPGDGSLKLTGVVCEDYFNTNAHIFALVRSNGQHQLDERTQYNGLMLEVEDKIPTSRMMHGVLLCASPGNKDKGVDVAHLLGFREQTIHNTGSLATEFAQDADKMAKYEDVLNRPGLHLNDCQKAAFDAAVRSATGVTALWGPPGTGKTKTNVVITEGLAQVDNLVGYTAPSNSAITVAMKAFLEFTRLKPEQIVRFRGEGVQRKFDENQTNNDNTADTQEESQAAANMVWQIYERKQKSETAEELSFYDFHNQLDRFINHEGANASSELHSEVKGYKKKQFELLRARSKGLDKSLIKKLQQEIQDLRAHRFTAAFFRMRCRVIFFTESQTACDSIYLHAPVRCLLIDEAGMSTVPSMAVPLGVFRKSLELLHLSGDHKQKPPVVVSQRQNEFSSLLQRPLLQSMYDMKDPRLIMLQTSYRLHPDIGWWNSNRFYDSKLESKNPGDPSLWNTVNEAIGLRMPDFTKERQLSRRLAIDVSDSPGHGRVAYSAPHASEMSMANEQEATFLVRFLLALIKFKPSDLNTARAINPKDILVITPYGGQRNLIREKLGEAHRQGICGSDGESVLSTRIVTTASSQGGEANIVLLSLVANKPGNAKALGFIKSPEQLNVETSRAKEFLFIFGNFKGWVDLIRNHDPQFNNRNFSGAIGTFVNMVSDLYSRGLIITCDDICSAAEGTTVDVNAFPSTQHAGKKRKADARLEYQR